ncbi:WD repeat-containing protein [Pestalotiopsis sp. NC0098]|nr:WD repeat-containing protein [Pestalotiopsis sp. NC0098]
MPATMDQVKKKAKVIRTADESETFEANVTIHVDGLVGSATISPSGRDVALASPEGLAIIDLDSPYNPPRRLSSHGSPWLVVDVQWSPFAARDYWVASTANHRCLIWNLNLREDAANGAIEHSLQGHSRAITDVNFSAHHPDILATCAVDGYVHSWDLRKPRKPALTFCDWYAGATQVKYNRQDPNILASSHDRWLHIWDERKTSKPLKSINAHASKIYGLDWNRTCDSSVATCSLDKTIKLWDYKVSDEPERVIRTDFPVWRARHTPFGSGLLAMPQSDPGNLYLYNRHRHENESIDSAVDPVAVFPGHGNCKVKEFLWRVRGGINDGVDQRDFQLVSWGEDNELRLHQMDPELLEQVGHVRGGHAPGKLSLTRKGAAYKSYRSLGDTGLRERRTATMSSGPRPGSGGDPYRRSALGFGMQSTVSGYRPGSTSWRGPPMRAKMTSGKSIDRKPDQLGWMKGITMSKKKRPHIEPPQRKDSKDSSMFGSTFHDHWEEPEALNEEIVRLDNRLPNVHWDNVDMNTLIVDASLKGPWGTDGETIYLKVKIDVPHGYPKSRAPKFIIEKTALMPEQTHRRIEAEVNQVAYQFAKKKRNCLEVAFSYLLGETDLSSSTSFFKNVRDLDDELDAMADESSSEDEDNDIPAGGSASMSQELTASTELDRDAALAPLNIGTVPPEPRLCGARWSNDGRLVCFFPSREERAKALFLTSNETAKEKPKGEPTFAGFGRLQQESPEPRQRHLDGSSMADEQSDTEDDDSSSSSDSENTYMHKISMWYLPNKRFRKTFSGSYSMRSSGGGTGVDTGTGTGTSKRRNVRPRNVISLYDFRDLLPSRQELAREYAIFGDGPEVCYHNARVADKYNRPDLAQVWEYAALLLRNDVPLEILDPAQRKDSVLVVAKNIVTRFKDQRSKNPAKSLTGRVKWGHHPLGKDVIKDLFDHFEANADIQMLAMLSCIFSEAAAEDSVAYAESRLTQPETPLPMKAPSFSLDYFPTDASLWHTSPAYQSYATSAVTTPGTVHTPSRMPGSWGSQENYWLGDPGSNSYSCGETPPSRTPKDTLSEHDATQSLSTSPEIRAFRRGNGTLTQGFASSFPRPFTTNTAPSSPPTRKRPSPGENFLANLTPNVTWGGNTIIAPISEPTTTRNSISDDGLKKDEEQPLVCTSIYVQIEDQSQFDDDGWLSVPLLEPPRAAVYEHYRHTYAELLFMWSLPLPRLEILKFNVLKSSTHANNASQLGGLDHDSFHEFQSNDNLSHTTLTLTQNGSKSPIALGKKEQLQSIVSSSRGLDVVGLCRIHETHLEPVKSIYANASVGGAAGTCDRCKRTQLQLNCVYCREPLDAMYVACFGCGCAMHESCLDEWHSFGETECPAGDECNCVEQAFSGQVESWAVLQGALRQGKIHLHRPSDESIPKTPNGQNNGSDKNDWESIASGSQLPAADAQGKPLGMGDGQQPLSAARISLGNRLRKSAGTWGSSASLRKKSGSVSSALGRK